MFNKYVWLLSGYLVMPRSFAVNSRCKRGACGFCNSSASLVPTIWWPMADAQPPTQRQPADLGE